MTDDRWKRLREIVESALGCPPEQRQALVEQMCGDDAALREEVEDLLRRSEPADDFLEPLALCPELGQVQLDDFAVVRRLRSGGMNDVYLARQISLDRDVALKVLIEDAASSGERVARFHAEARRVAKLRHPNIVPILADGHVGTTHYFAMELVPGHDLARELQLQRLCGSPDAVEPILPCHEKRDYFAQVARVCRDVARGLAHAHENGIVHRDVKPSNILLRPDRNVQIVDFGIARDQSMGHSGGDLGAGTLSYMSPEQAQVADAGIDHRTDIFSLGVVMYEMLTLELPLRCDTAAEFCRKLRVVEPPRVRSKNRRVPRDLATICHVAMAKDAGHRYQTAGDLADDLDRLLNLQSITMMPPGALQRCGSWLRRRRVPAIAAVLVLIAIWTAGEIGTVHAAQSQLVDARRVLDEVPTLDPSEFDRPQARTIAAAMTLLAERDGADGERVRAAERWIDGNRDSLGAGVHELPGRLFSPRLTLAAHDAAGAAVDAEATVCLIDPLTGQIGDEKPLGALPLTEAIVPEGLGRIVVRTAGRRQDYTRLFARGEEAVRIASAPPAEPAAELDMVAFDGGELELHDVGTPMSGINDRRLHVEPFLLDRCEVSNARYRAFLDATPNYPRPIHWQSIEPGSAADRLPVVFVSWYDARAFAEWCGKRLPTHAEWVFAARGPEGRRYPWGDDDPTRGNVNGSRRHPPGVAGRIASYLQSAVAVDSFDGTTPGQPDARTPAGLCHMFGNVSEWLESPAPDRDDGRLVPRLMRRLVIGDAWHALEQDPPGSLTAIQSRGPELSHAGNDVGFRCARSR